MKMSPFVRLKLGLPFVVVLGALFSVFVFPKMQTFITRVRPEMRIFVQVQVSADSEKTVSGWTLTKAVALIPGVLAVMLLFWFPATWGDCPR
ncbi:hypothetical protein [uncultured Cohaesibacter sp.]|uniref:hypothetical protein n=1 Tax=uncultured Cohaesibacter sp. TaxID=1002546 RepID=UPI0029304E3F|nr:hypothetical protein [uncultured Cohaesibacter sp.]